MSVPHLPAEIVQRICFELRLRIGHPLDGVYATQDEILGRKTLTAIALTSKLFRQASLPALFHTILLDRHTSLNTWYKLLIELLGSPDKARMVRHICINHGIHSFDWYRSRRTEKPFGPALSFWSNLLQWEQRINLPKPLCLAINQMILARCFLVEESLPYFLCTRAQVLKITRPYPTRGALHVQNVRAQSSGTARAVHLVQHLSSILQSREAQIDTAFESLPIEALPNLGSSVSLR